MNNKFKVMPCVVFSEEDEFDHNGPVIVLGCVDDPSLVLFFPVSLENAMLINHVLGKPFNGEECNANLETLAVYQTMITSWRTSGMYLSGIVLDVLYDEDMSDYSIVIRLALADSNGFLDGLVDSNFSHANVLAAMSSKAIIISDKLLSMMVPDLQELDDELIDEDETEFTDTNDKTSEEEIKRDKSKRTIGTKNNVFPEDKNLLKIVGKIMNGTIEGSGE